MRKRSASLVSIVAAGATLFALTTVGPSVANATALTGRPAILKVSGTKASALALPGLPTPSAADGVGPGDYLLITQTPAAGGQQFICTANFVWTDGSTKYLGAAGHCFLPSPDVTNPTGGTLDPAVVIGSDPYVQSVQVCVANCTFGGQLGAVVQGTMQTLGPVVYARQYVGTQANQVDIGNDFGLVTIPSSLAGIVRPTEPVWGGPNGTAPGTFPSVVCVYGNGVGLGETFATKARAGVGMGIKNGAWFADMPSSPGDSGSAVLNCTPGSPPTALGILTHLDLNGDQGVVAGTTVAQAISMAQEAGLNLQVVNG